MGSVSVGLPIWLPGSVVSSCSEHHIHKMISAGYPLPTAAVAARALKKSDIMIECMAKSDNLSSISANYSDFCW